MLLWVLTCRLASGVTCLMNESQNGPHLHAVLYLSAFSELGPQNQTGVGPHLHVSIYCLDSINYIKEKRKLAELQSF